MMCLAVPGKILSLDERVSDFRAGIVDFQGSEVKVSLALVPEAVEGDWVLVHAGYAISRLEEKDALATWQYLKEAGLAEP